MAQSIVDAQAVIYLVALIENKDVQLKKNVCSCLAQIAKHNQDLAFILVEHEILKKLLTCLRESDVNVKKNAATCLREIARQSVDLAKMISTTGGVPIIID